MARAPSCRMRPTLTVSTLQRSDHSPSHRSFTGVGMSGGRDSTMMGTTKRGLEPQRPHPPGT